MPIFGQKIRYQSGRVAAWLVRQSWACRWCIQFIKDEADVVGSAQDFPDEPARTDRIELDSCKRLAEGCCLLMQLYTGIIARNQQIVVRGLMQIVQARTGTEQGVELRSLMLKLLESELYQEANGQHKSKGYA
ncbi:hypothetical protein [Desulfocurvibacter africanus]|uniref:hypothetical protein n=1 Tax=Desulfocurvibacter africanus TaxID=873 RepID=UPI00047F2B08|nr:hypothetical protein [Desulfocurvibacter africanus]